MTRSSSAGVRTRSINRAISIFLLVVLFATPLMIGSNRPVYWMLNSTVLLGVTAFVLFLSAFGVIKLRAKLDRWKLISTLGFMYLAAITLQLVIASVWSSSGLFSQSTILMGLLRVMSYGCILFLTMQVATNVKRARRLAWGVFGVVILMAIYALVAEQVPELLLYEKDAYVNVVSGPFINRNSFATYLAMGSALGTSLVLRVDRDGEMRKKRGRMDVELIIGRLALFVVVLLLFATVLTTGSRMGTFVGLLGILVPVALRVGQAERVDETRQALVGLSIALVSLLAFVAVSAMYGGVVFDRLGSTGMASDVRWVLYDNVWKVVLEQPFTGFGLDSFELAFRAGQDLPVSPDLRWQHAHNTYLALWLEMGFLFGSLPMLFCGAVLVRLLKRGGKNQYTGYLAQAGVSVIIIAAIHSLVDFSLEIEANVFLFLVILGLGLAPDDSRVE